MASFGFEKIKRSKCGEVTQNQLYVTYDQICQCDCPGCRNKGLPQEEMKSDRNKLNRVILKNAEKFRHIIFGGGEPLYQIDHIVDVIRRIKKKREEGIDRIVHQGIRLLNGKSREDDKISFSLTTNGARDIFLEKIYMTYNCAYCKKFDRIILSRYHDDDIVNDRLFRANGTLITTSDIQSLCPIMLYKMQLSCLCQSGGIETIEDVLRYIEWAKSIGIKDIMFSNYQQDITPAEAKQAGCDSKMLREVQKALVETHGYVMQDTFVFSAGYKISTYRKEVEPSQVDEFKIFLYGGQDVVTISFREFLNKDELEEAWNNAKKRTYNYSAMPNGAMYADWSCKNLI